MFTKDKYKPFRPSPLAQQVRADSPSSRRSKEESTAATTVQQSRAAASELTQPLGKLSLEQDQPPRTASTEDTEMLDAPMSKDVAVPTTPPQEDLKKLIEECITNGTEADAEILRQQSEEGTWPHEQIRLGLQWAAYKLLLQLEEIEDALDDDASLGPIQEAQRCCRNIVELSSREEQLVETSSGISAGELMVKLATYLV